jgi:hypothetical protein
MERLGEKVAGLRIIEKEKAKEKFVAERRRRWHGSGLRTST